MGERQTYSANLVPFSKNSTITYLVPVVSGSAERRLIGSYVSSLGKSAEEIIILGWNGSSLQGLTQHFTQLLPLVEQHTYKHLLYPILHYFHEPDRFSSAPLSIASLYDSILIMETAVAEKLRMDPVAYMPLKRAIESYADQMCRSRKIKPLEVSPEINVTAISSKGIALAHSQMEERLEQLRYSSSRNKIYALVKEDGWSIQEAK